jgi:hypothetical protein
LKLRISISGQLEISKQVYHFSAASDLNEPVSVEVRLATLAPG